jgi:nucleoside-diphosphate-sugar epimerase
MWGTGSGRGTLPGNYNVLLAAREANVKRIVFASSSSVYGNTNVFRTVRITRQAPFLLIAASKLAGERYCKVFIRLYGLETIPSL